MKTKYISLLVLVAMLLFSGCNFVNQLQSPQTAATEQTSDIPSSVENSSTNYRIADNFVIKAEKYAMNDEYFIYYQEDNEALTKIANLGFYEQPLMISGTTIYYILSNGKHPVVTAIDFYGNVIASIELDQFSFSRGWLLYSDESYIYGAGGDSVNENADFFFKVDLKMNDYVVLPAVPVEFRTANLDELAEDLREAVGNHAEDIYVHRATARLDANGMFYRLGLQITAKQENKIVYGNLLFDWYYQDKDYKNKANPWFNRLDEVIEVASDPLPLKTFLEYVQTIGLSGVVPSTLSNAIYDYKLYWNGGMSGISYPQKDDILIRYVKFEDNAFHPTVPLTQLPELHFVVENWDYSKTIAATDSYASDFIATEILYIFFP